MADETRTVRSPVRIDLSDTAQVAGALVLGALGVLVLIRRGFRPAALGR